jgi:hypothetical protein
MRVTSKENCTKTYANANECNDINKEHCISMLPDKKIVYMNFPNFSILPENLPIFPENFPRFNFSGKLDNPILSYFWRRSRISLVTKQYRVLKLGGRKTYHRAKTSKNPLCGIRVLFVCLFVTTRGYFSGPQLGAPAFILQCQQNGGGDNCSFMILLLSDRDEFIICVHS